MAVAGVVGRKVVYVEQHQRERQAAARRAGPFGGQLLVEIAAVEHAGQPVQQHQFFQQVGLVLQRQVGVYPRPHHVRVQRLGDAVHRAQAQAMGFCAGVSAGGDQDDRNRCRRGVRLELAADRKAVHAWHLHVQQDQIRRVAVAHRERLWARGGHEHLVVAREGLHQFGNVLGLVVDHQQPGFAVGAVQQGGRRKGCEGHGTGQVAGDKVEMGRRAAGPPFDHAAVAGAPPYLPACGARHAQGPCGSHVTFWRPACKNRELTLGSRPMHHTRSTKIVATLGPASSDPTLLEQMIRAGVNVVRLNFSHGKAQDHIDRARLVREAAQRVGREVAIMADLQGPKIRVGKFAEGKVFLEQGQKFVLDAGRTELGDIDAVGLDYKSLPSEVKAGDVLLLNDGLIVIVVDAVRRRQRCTPPSSWAASCPTTKASTNKAAA